MKSDGVFRPRQETSFEEAPLKSTGFTMFGKEISIADPHCYAKQVIDTGDDKIKYFIKRCKSGPETGSLLNPYGINFMPGDERKKAVSHGHNKYEFSKVSQEVFDFYMSFMRSQGIQFLRRAERAMN